ncbi:hypothetical protein [Sulfoacidibacillus thermotolerans]|uniref:Uncharacterized protein n=1 Tax=Sulfoacidibacillus thermotolerans TaxID=1765684 RepID=A0A2U3D901_SULT2|nr:hypothetical protein [Sulfoacidibacillus thermotolerans]PWI57762.1 hypothetical protein BM613_07215 [Sulfoacidibacillus thermotolerans]
MSNQAPLPTVFLPAATGKRLSEAKLEQTLAPAKPLDSPVVRNDDTQSLSFAWEREHITQRVKRPRQIATSKQKQSLLPRTQQSTISNYLQAYLNGTPICVLTQAGRFCGQVVYVDNNQLKLIDNAGSTRTIAIDALQSIAPSTKMAAQSL